MLDFVQKIDLKKFTERFDPFQNCIWIKLTTPLTVAEILSAVPVSALEVEQKQEYGIWNVEERDVHAGRVKWLIDNWSDKFPIDLDFGMPNLGYPSTQLICDGNHRLMAAIILKKKYINATCSGEEKEINKYVYAEM